MTPAARPGAFPVVEDVFGVDITAPTALRQLLTRPGNWRKVAPASAAVDPKRSERGEAGDDLGRGAGPAPQAPLGKHRNPLSGIPDSLPEIDPVHFDARRQRSALFDARATVLAGEPSAKCRRELLTGASSVNIKRGENNRFAYGGLFTCGSPWTCPICAVKIRARRKDEAQAVMEGVIADGGSLVMVTFTLPHYNDETSLSVIRRLSKAFTSVIRGRPWSGDSLAEQQHKIDNGKGERIVVGLRRSMGYVGIIKALEVTHGDNGYHGHYHTVFAFDQPLDNRAFAQFMGYVEQRYCDAVVGGGGRRPSKRNGVDFERITQPDQLSAYLTKIDEDPAARKAAKATNTEGLASAAYEVSGVHKVGRKDNRSLWQVLESFATTGDMAEADIFRDYYRGTKGRPALYISPALRAKYLTEPAKTDEEIAAEEEDGTTEATIARALWYRICAVRGARLRVLELAELDGMDAVENYLRDGLGLPVVRRMLPAGMPEFGLAET